MAEKTERPILMVTSDKLAYIIASMPAANEAFFIPEMLALKDSMSIIIIPRDISQKMVHIGAVTLTGNIDPKIPLTPPILEGIL